MTIGILLVGLLFVILFSIFLEILFRCPPIVAAVILLISLLVFAILIGLGVITTALLIWVIIYTLASLVTAYVTCLFLDRVCNNNNNSCNNNSCNNNFSSF